MDPYRFSVKAQLTSRPRVIAEVKDACGRVGPPRSSSDNGRSPWAAFDNAVVSAVSEAINNIVLHAYEGGSDDDVEFVIELGESALFVRIVDRGSPADFEPPFSEPPPLAEGGMGMFLIHACVDRADYLPGPPNHWTLEKRYPPAGPADADDVSADADDVSTDAQKVAEPPTDPPRSDS